MKFKFLVVCIQLQIAFSFAQILPSNRAVDWSMAGYKGVIPDYPGVIDITNYGGNGNGVSINDTAFLDAVNALSGADGVIYFPSGLYVFNSALTLRSGLILRGASSDSTTLKFDLPAGNSLDAINISGSTTIISSAIVSNAVKDSSFVIVDDASAFAAGDYIKISFNDSSLLFSSWAYGTVGQIIKIASITNDKMFFESPLRLDYDTLKFPKVTKLNMITGVGIECLKVQRGDPTTSQTSNITFNYASQCWISGIESYSCNFSHVELNRTTGISITGSYFHDAFAYGGGGQGYGVICQTTSGECLIENNIFKHLRHSMLLQSGANGNVFGYNYSIDPFWTEPSLPANSAGDMVLHGNYTYANLFEGNIGQNIVIDDSHGINGSYNTFFRNRGDLYGIFMNNNPASNNQNLIGNEVTNTGFLLGMYYISGTDHFQHGNNVKETIYAAGTTTLADISYYNSSIPLFLQSIGNWPSIGLPNTISSGTIPAKERYISGDYTTCSSFIPTTGLSSNNTSPDQISIFPNPSKESLHLRFSETTKFPMQLYIYNSTGNVAGKFIATSSLMTLDVSSYSKGIYFIKAEHKEKTVHPLKFVIQ